MSKYKFYLFTQDTCEFCQELDKHLATLSAEINDRLIRVPLKDDDGERTEFAEELCVDLTPALVVAERGKEDPDDPDEELYPESIAPRYGVRGIKEGLSEFLAQYA